LPSFRDSLKLSTIARLTQVSCNIVSVIAVARILTPHEIGVFSVAAASLFLLQYLRDFGVSPYIVQEPQLDTQKIKAASGVAVGISYGVGISFIIFAPILGAFYDNPSIKNLIYILCLGFFILPFSIPLYAILRRQMRFDLTFRIEIFSALAQPSITIILALNDFSYYSMAIGQVSGQIATCLLTFYFSNAENFLLPSIKNWSAVIRFGSKSTIISILEGGSLEIGNLMLGRTLGFEAVSYHSRAMSFVNILQNRLMSSFYGVVAPAFAKANREYRKIEHAYLHGLSCITGFSFFVMGYIGLMAHPTIYILFGDQWGAAAPVLQILTLGGFFFPIWNMTGSILMMIGFINTKFVCALISQSVFATSLIYTAFHSIEQVAASFVLMNLTAAGLHSYAFERATGISMKRIWKSIVRSACTSFVGLGPAIFTVSIYGFDPTSPFMVVAVTSMLCGITWLTAVYLLKDPIRFEFNRVFSSLAPLLFRKNRS
jgi:O-antigen/teichoic acid export membrane protein